MITLSYELLGVMMIAPMMIGFVMCFIINFCDLAFKRKQIKALEDEYANQVDKKMKLFRDGLKIKDENVELKKEIIKKDQEIKELEDNVAREFALRKKMEQKKRTNKAQYRKIEALRNRFKAIKKGEVYSGKEVIEDGIKMYSIKVNGATYILKRSNFKIIK